MKSNKSKLLEILKLHSSSNRPDDAIYFCDYKNNTKAVEGYTWTKDNVFYIWFHGSNSTWDWITNFLYPKKIVPYNNINPLIRVHRGYINRYKLVRNLLHDRFTYSNCNKVIVTGYSMGGGLTPICAVDMQYNFNIPVESYAFEPPRVGNYYFKKSVEHRVDCHYTTYGNDIVTKIPPKLFLFKHIGHNHHYGPSRKWYKFSIKDHYIQYLFNALNAVNTTSI